jgi:hypothetical protein
MYSHTRKSVISARTHAGFGVAFGSLLRSVMFAYMYDGS